MRKKSAGDQWTHRPQEELRYLSMTEDIQEIYCQPQRGNCKYDIQPWKNQHENPSQSPERRPYLSRPAPSSIKSQKPLQIKLIKSSAKVLQPTNCCNNSFRVKPALSKRNSTTTQVKLLSENKPESRTSTRRNEPSAKTTTRNNFKEKDDFDEELSSFHSPVNLIVYPMVTENRKRRLFRKMDKFQNFVSVSLRK